MNQIQIQSVLANLREGLAEIEAWPPERIKLEAFVSGDPICGTCYCAAGLLATKPFFANQGLRLDHLTYKWGGSEAIKQMLFVDVTPISNDISVLDSLFGKDAYNRLFDTYGSGWEDCELLNEAGGTMTEHALVVARFKHQIAAYEGQEALNA